MRLRNGQHGYGAVTKALHWLTVALFATQFVVGYTMDTDPDLPQVECDPVGEGRSGGDTSDAEDERLDRVEERCEAREDAREQAAEEQIPTLHVVLGIAILAVGLVRVAWRRLTPLPPWDPRLSTTDQRVVHATEAVLLSLMFVVPATGLLLVADRDLVALHVVAHVCFFVALGAHLTMVLGRRLLPRMLPGSRPVA
ncbi:cytochrome b561 [Nocardioides thalensis]|uniref:Cytochrome b561 n=1 Tax=Nocardioides thalensis TaxID=1914755 RepID=A0A853BZ43_9ACTN|nr:cytochrome b/b6 domain-containing protein [Nocardioides thalensis]NYJ01230.1 cytochrome b561 [Nocardioides thalensis]